MKFIRRATILLISFLLVLVAILAMRTARFRPIEVPAPAPAESMDVDSNAAAARLARAIQIPTISYEDPEKSDTAKFLAFHDLLIELFPKSHAALKREVVNEFSLLYTWGGSNPELKPIILMSHMDVVPISPGTEGDWLHTPFSGDVADGFVWGRGTMDDKSGVLASLEAVEHLLAAGFAPKRTVILAFGHDEEIGGGNGAPKIVELLKSRGTNAEFVLDEGGSITQGIIPDVTRSVALIGVAEKGYMSLELSVMQTGGHSSTPPRNTAIGILSAAVARLEENQMPARIEGPSLQLFQNVGPHMPISRRVVFANLWFFRPVITSILSGSAATNATVRTTTATTIFESGDKANVLPVNARSVVNFRILPGDSLDDVTAHVRRVVADDRIKIQQIGTANEAAPPCDPAAPAFKVVATTIRQVCGNDILVSPYLVVGATDSRYYYPISKNVYRFGALRMEPSDLERMHGTNERVSIENYAEAIRFYAQLIRNVDALP
jgi:carboxypeptidase PM20D1